MKFQAYARHTDASSEAPVEKLWTEGANPVDEATRKIFFDATRRENARARGVRSLSRAASLDRPRSARTISLA